MEQNPSQNLSDEQLVEMALKKSADFGLIIDRYQEKLARYLKRFAGLNNDDLQDVLQESFIDIYRNLNDFKKDLKFSSWIYRIAHNKAIDLIRKGKKYFLASYAENESEDLIEKIADEFKMQDEQDRKLLANLVSKIFFQMAPAYREILILKFIEGRDYEEISDILKMPMGSVASSLNRAKKKFKKVAQENNVNFYDSF